MIGNALQTWPQSRAWRRKGETGFAGKCRVNKESFAVQRATRIIVTRAALICAKGNAANDAARAQVSPNRQGQCGSRVRADDRPRSPRWPARATAPRARCGRRVQSGAAAATPTATAAEAKYSRK